ncbi:3'-5' exonuclease [Streptomyces sp. NPDC060198]|uniref:3'-5' exonuclease n=1 Tax=Streptomyces sp. NPDC060198 TaxID=3347070 RepID=UPI00365B89C2
MSASARGPGVLTPPRTRSPLGTGASEQGPGTGKTVVAPRRVGHLPGFLRDGERIPLTPYTNPLVDALRCGLANLVEDAHLRDRADITTVDTPAKGLEFRCVAVIGVHEGALPYPGAVTPADADALQHEADLTAERCLLFVACTRARDGLHVSWTGVPSAFPAEAGEVRLSDGLTTLRPEG